MFKKHGRIKLKMDIGTIILISAFAIGIGFFIILIITINKEARERGFAKKESGSKGLYSSKTLKKHIKNVRK